MLIYDCDKSETKMADSPEICGRSQPAEGDQYPCHPDTDVTEGDVGVGIAVDEGGDILGGQQ